jgi:hypothetical protein
VEEDELSRELQKQLIGQTVDGVVDKPGDEPDVSDLLPPRVADPVDRYLPGVLLPPKRHGKAADSAASVLNDEELLTVADE